MDRTACSFSPDGAGCGYQPARIGLEAGPLSQWLRAGLVGAGLPAVLVETREELAGKVEQIELQQSLVIKSSEDSAKADADREALRKELEARTGELDSLKT